MDLFFSLLPWAIFTVLLIIPTLKLLARAGRSRMWAALYLLPGIGVLVILWLLAYGRARPASAGANVG